MEKLNPIIQRKWSIEQMIRKLYIRLLVPAHLFHFWSIKPIDKLFRDHLFDS